MSIKPTLNCMPIEVFEEIFEKLENPIDRLSARKVSRTFRSIIDDVGIGFTYILFCIHSNFKSTLTFDGTSVEYTNIGGDSITVHRKIGEHKTVGGTCLEIVLNDLALSLNGTLHHLEIRFEGRYNQLNFDTLISKLEVLEFVKTKYLTLHNFTSLQVFQLLPHFEVGTLRSIEMIDVKDNIQFEEIAELEQWIKAPVIKWIPSKIPENILIEAFFHCQLFSTDSNSISVQDAVKIRDILFPSKNFTSCKIRVLSTDSYSEVVKIFEPSCVFPRGAAHFSLEYSANGDLFEIWFTKLHIAIKRKIQGRNEEHVNSCDSITKISHWSYSIPY